MSKKLKFYPLGSQPNKELYLCDVVMVWSLTKVTSLVLEIKMKYGTNILTIY